MSLFLALIQSFPILSLVVPVLSFIPLIKPLTWKYKNLCRLWVGVGCIINALGFYAFGVVNDAMWKSYVMAPLWLLLAVLWILQAFRAQYWEREKEAIIARWRT